MLISTDKLEELREIFDHFDTNSDGAISATEFAGLLKALDAGTSPEEAAIGFREIDADSGGAIEFDEFVDWWTDR